MSRPLILAVDPDPAELERVERELQRYGREYRIRGEESAAAARACLHTAQERGEPVALVLAAPDLPDAPGPDLLCDVRALHPEAKRALLVPWGAWGWRTMADTILTTMARGHMDYYVLRPLGAYDELFHRTVAEFVHEWSRASGRAASEVTLVIPPLGPQATEVRDLIVRNGITSTVLDTDSPEGAACLRDHGLEGVRDPVVIVHGRPLRDPSPQEVSRAFGVDTDPGEAREIDVLVVGAGPSGLAAAVYAASEGLSTLVVEREAIGGQAGTSSLIRNYLGFPRGISGGELAQRSYQQAWVFGARFVHTREVLALRGEGDRYVARIGGAGDVAARAVVLAGGVTYRRLDVPALESFTGAGVFYGASLAEARGLSGARVVVVGGGNSAGQAAMHLSRYAERVTIVVRGAGLEATMSRYLIEAIAATDNVGVLPRHEVVDARGAGRLERLVLRDNELGALREEPADALFILIGARPHTHWLPREIGRDAFGFVLTGRAALADRDAAARWPLAREPLAFETVLPGVFAVGDIRHGSVKRVASAVGEGSVVVPQVHEHLQGLAAVPD